MAGREYEAMVSKAIIGFLDLNHQTVIELSKLDTLIQDQHIGLTHTADDEADLLRMGKLLGADQVIFAHSSHSNVSGGYLVRVQVRAIDVESADTLWDGVARITEPAEHLDQVLASLPQIAIYRALCPTEIGFKWTEYGEKGTGGCYKP